MLRRAGRALALILLAVLPFWPSLDGGFIEDDRPIIRDRPELRDVANVPALFAQTYWPRDQPGGLYRPLTLASYALDRAVWGADAAGAPSPFGVHATNLILNALAALLVFALLRGRGGEAAGAFAGAALFAVHPVHVEAVSHLVGRADLLMTVCFLAAFLLHGRGLAGRLAAALLYLLACLSKEMAVVLPGVLLVRAWLERGGGTLGGFARAQAVALAPMTLALLVFLALRGFALGAAANPPVRFALFAAPQYLAFQDPAPFEVALTMLHALGEILLLLVAPFRLSADYSGFPHATGVSAAAALSGLAVATLVALALAALRRGRREPIFWLAWLGLTWLPVSNLLFPSGIVLAERALYLPSVALSGVVALGTGALVARDRRLALAPALVVTLFAALSFARAGLWTDARGLHEETVARGRHSGHIAKTGLVAELLSELARRPDADTLARALALARASLEERPTATNLAQVALLEEYSGQLDSALARRKSLFAFAPEDLENRAAIVRLLEALIPRREAEADTRAVLELCGTGYRLAERSGDPSLVARWRARVDRAFERYLEEAIAAGDRDELRRRLDELERAFPGHPLLAIRGSMG